MRRHLHSHLWDAAGSVSCRQSKHHYQYDLREKYKKQLLPRQLSGPDTGGTTNNAAAFHWRQSEWLSGADLAAQHLS